MQRWTDQRMERFIGGLLRVGVLLSAVLVFVGAVVHLAGHAGDRPGLHVFRGEPLALRGIEGIVLGALALDGPGLIQLGLLVLVATPVARVAFSVFAFAAQRDRTYVLVTLTVLAILCFGLFGVRA
jgi:uncharacterized membrane protein